MKHPHSEFIIAWANGKSIQWRFTANDDWLDLNNSSPSWEPMLQYRIKPPAPKWPESTMSYDELKDSYYVFGRDNYEQSSWHSDAARNLANAALAHACETGLVLPVIDGAITVPSGINVQVGGIKL